MDDIIKFRKNKIKDLDADAIDADKNSKFKLLHIMAIEYSQDVAQVRFVFILCSCQCWSICNFQKFTLL